MLNPYFSSVGVASERDLVNALVTEFIQINGMECMYIPRAFQRYDQILGEDARSKFTSAIALEMYRETSTAPTGQGDILSRFGLEIKDSYNFTVSPDRWRKVVGNITELYRPREGDLIYINQQTSSDPNIALFEIKFVEHEEPHYQLGQTSQWKLKCEMFRYSNEVFQTGIAELDSYGQDIGYDSALFRFADESGNLFLQEGGADYYVDEPTWHNEATTERSYADNDVFQEEVKLIVDRPFNTINPFTEL